MNGEYELQWVQDNGYAGETDFAIRTGQRGSIYFNEVDRHHRPLNTEAGYIIPCHAEPTRSTCGHLIQQFLALGA